MAFDAYSPNNPSFVKPSAGTPGTVPAGSPPGTSYYNQRDPLSPVKSWKDQLKKDWMSATTNPQSLGLSDPEKEKMIGEATAQGNAQLNGQLSQMNQSALAGQGFQAGAFGATARDVADQGQKAAAQATVGVNQLNQQLIDQNKQRILTEMDQARERSRENTRFWTQFGVDSLAGLFTAAKGGDLSSVFSNLGGGGATAPPASMDGGSGEFGPGLDLSTM